MARILTVAEYVESMSPDLRTVGTKLTAVLDNGLSKATGTIWHGHPVWMTGKTPLAGFKAHATHVTFMLWSGQLITDRSGRLQASGRSGMASLKLEAGDKIDENVFVNWLHQVQALELP